ncbi:hypothetical protein [Methylocystis heyeri]|uniref:Tetratricopeptide repeat protein n=1 Tax=Methylocystis heyeri TaxID=391905 RepID=A0A6B8KLP4_9HYPH|nr:hypothetical protein [Methylocystis heyeri]QGM47633.1 hypothetical protein H2LOC_019205 [Methylocystis heyeri]
MPAKIKPRDGAFIALLVAAALTPGVGLAAAAAESGLPGQLGKNPAQQHRGEPAASEPAHKPVIGEEAPGPDDYALRYYASLNQTNRVNAEISRLQRLYPGYEPPADLYSKQTEGDVDETPLWTLYTANKLDELRKTIASLESENAGWKPSSDLMLKVRRKEMRGRIASLTQEGRWQDLVEFVKTDGLNATDQDVDIEWMIAEALARTKQTNEAVALFKAILMSSKDQQILIATLQKAMGVLRMADVETLLATLPPGADGSSQYQSLMTDITRGRIAAYLHDERAEEPPAADVASFENYARESRESDQLGLVAWYDYKRRDFRNALEWFKAAIENGGDAMIAHGLAHTLRALGKMREAEEVAYAWRTPLVNNGILFVDLLERDLTRETPPFIESDRLARYARATMEMASGEGAQALGWYAFNSCQFDIALFWFERAAAWLPKDATVYGYALALRRLKQEKPFYEIANRYDGLDAKVIELLFPDNYYHPPSPCDGKNAAQLHGPAVRALGYVSPGPAMIPGAAPNYDPSAYSSPTRDQKNSSDPASQAAVDELEAARILRNLKGKFPVAVISDNPLRFLPLPLQNGAGRQTLPGLDPSLRPDPGRASMPLVARRVPGVGAMPYERYGFSLLPAWNGQEAASWPPASMQIAPAGTQWANQEADPAHSGAASLDATPNYYGSVGAPLASPQFPGAPARAAATRPTAPRPAAYGQYPQPVSR